ncbi:deoxycytidylate deaminase [Budvicia diplopodorum]|uniref:deoxycytidylate deaminase n=1 Tax=Budvicia diplopodorum TaxID=1119056 RepID=UPI00135B7813|nr:dCMP deaminase family protein [Budvicia diplopodorum]
MERHEYYMNIAMAVRKKANCLGRKVGGVMVKDNRIISTGYNGTPEGITNCTDGGCVRCREREAYKASVGYDVCICVHAEQNAIISAARFGNPVEGSVVYSTLRPCFDCTKSMLQAKVQAIYYLHDWIHPISELQEQYELLQAQFAGGVHQVVMDDPEADWANAVPAPVQG